MTKMEIIENIFKLDTQTINQNLLKLSKEKRITTGCYTVLGPYDNFYYKELMKIIDKACKSKSYTRYIKRIPKHELVYLFNKLQKDMEKAATFIEEQKALPFEETQMQLLIKSGEIRWGK